MKRTITALSAVALLALTACGAAAEATTPAAAPQEHMPPHTVREPINALEPGTDKEILEDEPGWECLTMGNKICGPVATDYADAWTRLDPTLIPDNASEFKVEYRGKALKGIHFSPDMYHTVDSATKGYVHVFSVER